MKASYDAWPADMCTITGRLFRAESPSCSQCKLRLGRTPGASVGVSGLILEVLPRSSGLPRTRRFCSGSLSAERGSVAVRTAPAELRNLARSRGTWRLGCIDKRLGRRGVSEQGTFASVFVRDKYAAFVYGRPTPIWKLLGAIANKRCADIVQTMSRSKLPAESVISTRCCG
jgi:hypothetical protein